MPEEGIDAIAVIIDTSGSLPAQTLADFWTEVREVATEIQPESVHILQVDAAVQDAVEYAACDLPDEIVIKGRGGTDFRPGFAWLDEQGIQPSVCPYLTDMLCSSKPSTHMTDIDGAWETIRARAELHDLRIHDIRHSCAAPPYLLAA